MSEPRKPSELDPRAHANATERPVVRRVQSRELFGSASELVIEHSGREYRLRVTQHGKLILTA
jgi:hemin uptake protein HemP